MAFEGLSEKLGTVFKNLKNRGKLNEKDIKSAMREVRLALLEADVSYKVAKEFVAAVSERAVGEQVMNSLTPAQQVIKIVNEELTELMGQSAERLQIGSKIPAVFLLCGLQGSGKTTHAGKIALFLKDKGHRPLLAACDIYRPAAIKQLQIIGEQADVKVFEMGKTDPVKVSKEAIKYAKDYGHDIVILDTAGRLHVDEELMNELSSIKKAVDLQEILLVVDSMTGQDAVNVAQSFNEKLGITGVVLTKLDGDTRGGAALSVRHVTGCPIKFAGVGEKLEDLEVFHPDRMASRILGMGDVMSLIEKAEQNMDEAAAEKMAEKLKQGGFDLDDMLDQILQVKNMGSMGDIMKMLPGGKKLKQEPDDKNMVVIQAVIQSMTKGERSKPKTINPKRKIRIAAGSGTTVADVNRVLKQFQQTSKIMKMMNSKGGMKKISKMMGGMPGGQGGPGGMGGMPGLPS